MIWNEKIKIITQLEFEKNILKTTYSTSRILFWIIKYEISHKTGYEVAPRLDTNLTLIISHNKHQTQTNIHRLFITIEKVLSLNDSIRKPWGAASTDF